MSPTRHSQSTGAALGEAWASRGSARVVAIRVGGAPTIGSPRPLAHAIPQMMPEDELPFWTPEWRALIQEGHDALAHGESVEFKNFHELATWLLTPNDAE